MANDAADAKTTAMCWFDLHLPTPNQPECRGLRRFAIMDASATTARRCLCINRDRGRTPIRPMRRVPSSVPPPGTAQQSAEARFWAAGRLPQRRKTTADTDACCLIFHDPMTFFKKLCCTNKEVLFKKNPTTHNAPLPATGPPRQPQQQVTAPTHGSHKLTLQANPKSQRVYYPK